MQPRSSQKWLLDLLDLLELLAHFLRLILYPAKRQCIMQIG